jgi:hypothetical protein
MIPVSVPPISNLLSGLHLDTHLGAIFPPVLSPFNSPLLRTTRVDSITAAVPSSHHITSTKKDLHLTHPREFANPAGLSTHDVRPLEGRGRTYEGLY